ncbi:MAG TPA: ATP-binding protein, partial [Chitinophagales bacterium]|nr:ATP-binding protein [Chitinophagales bacterium]
MSDIVWSVNPKNDSAKYLIERMRVFAGDLVASSGIELHFNYEKGAEDVKLTMEQRKNVFLIFKETVYNSAKYSGGKNIYIDLKKTTKGLTLIISDDGKGFDVNNYKSKNGNGIKNMRLRAEEIQAVYNIESRPGRTATTLNI